MQFSFSRWTLAWALTISLAVVATGGCKSGSSYGLSSVPGMGWLSKSKGDSSDSALADNELPPAPAYSETPFAEKTAAKSGLSASSNSRNRYANAPAGYNASTSHPRTSSPKSSLTGRQYDSPKAGSYARDAYDPNGYKTGSSNSDSYTAGPYGSRSSTAGSGTSVLSTTRPYDRGSYNGKAYGQDRFGGGTQTADRRGPGSYDSRSYDASPGRNTDTRPGSYDGKYAPRPRSSSS